MYICILNSENVQTDLQMTREIRGTILSGRTVLMNINSEREALGYKRLSIK